MSRLAGTPGLDAGLKSSLWSSPPARPSQTPLLQQAQRMGTANAASHLQQAQQQARIPESTAAGYVHPHLRGLSTPPKENGSRAVPPHLQGCKVPIKEIVNSTSSPPVSPHLQSLNTPSKDNVSLNRPLPPHLQASKTPSKLNVENFGLNRPVPPHMRIKTAVVISSFDDRVESNVTQKHLSLDCNIPVVVKPLAAPLESTKHSVPPTSRAELTNEELFLAKMMQKPMKNTAAPKKVIDEKERSTEVQVQAAQFLTVDSRDEIQPFMLLPARSKFRPTEQSDKEMQAFLSNRVNGPAANGKKYIITSGQQSPQTRPAASQPGGNGRGTLRVESSIRKENASPCGRADPYSTFGPRDLATKVGPLRPGNVMRSKEPNDTPLSEDALVKPGIEPRRSSEGFEDNISDTGVEEKPKENVRASLGQDVKNELVDWDGKMMPPPLDWEADRVPFDNSFMPKYIREDWEPKVPCGPSAAIDTRAEEFQLAVPVEGATFVIPPEQPLTLPDYANSENEQRQRRQTAEITSATVSKRLEKRFKAAQGWAEAQQAHNLAIMTKEPEPHPYAPTIDVYLRPGTETDAKGIVDIYNRYVQTPHSIITEDQAPISEADIVFLIDHCKGEKLPMIVAVQGKMPLSSQDKHLNRSEQKCTAQLPAHKRIIGFGYAETYNYGIGGGRNGRSRFTASIHFYVDSEYTGKKVGQSLLDRLIKSLSHGYGARDGYEWMDSTNNPVYNPGGVRRWHQIVIQFAIRPKDDPNYERMQDFLRRYFFEEEGRIRRIGRSSVDGPGSPGFVDLIFFAKEASASTEFSPIV